MSLKDKVDENVTYERYGDCCEVNNELIYNDVKQAVNMFREDLRLYDQDTYMTQEEIVELMKKYDEIFGMFDDE